MSTGEPLGYHDDVGQFHPTSKVLAGQSAFERGGGLLDTDALNPLRDAFPIVLLPQPIPDGSITMLPAPESSPLIGTDGVKTLKADAPAPRYEWIEEPLVEPTPAQRTYVEIFNTPIYDTLAADLAASMAPWRAEGLRIRAVQERAQMPDLGPHGCRVYHAECLQFLRSLPDNSVDMVGTDEPYSSGGAFRGDRALPPERKYASTGSTFRTEAATFAGDTRDQRAFLMWCTLWLTECYRVLKPGRICTLFADWRQIGLIQDAIQAGGFVLRGVGTWGKGPGSGRPRKGGYWTEDEFWVWGSKGPMPHFDSDDPAGYTRGHIHHTPDEQDTARGHIDCPPDRSQRHHITAKPVHVMEHIISPCPPGGIVLDPFAGSGSTLVAALRTGRRALGCEVVGGYVDKANARIEAEAAGVSLEATGTETRSDQGLLFGV